MTKEVIKNKIDLFRICIKGSLYCYRDNPKMIEKSKKLGFKFENPFDRIEDFSVGPVQGYFAELRSYPGTLFVVGRGSEDIEKDNADWQTNFKFKLITQKIKTKIKVHEGFLGYYKKVKRTILSKSTEIKQIVVTGHSLGAALATLCAENLAFKFPTKEIICVPLSSPRVGNSEFVKTYNMKIKYSYRLFLSMDIVTRVPLWICGYRHVKGAIKLKSPWHWIHLLAFITGCPICHYPHLLLEALTKKEN